MSNRDIYNASVQSASSGKLVTAQAAQTTFQVSVDNVKSVIGYTLQGGNANNATLLSTEKAANLSRLVTLFQAEQTKQQAIMVARDLLRAGGGDLAAF
jgi:hypothetical protein